MPYFEGNYKPDSFYKKIQLNRQNKMHTLCLLDIKVKEVAYEDMLKYGIFRFSRFCLAAVVYSLLFRFPFSSSQGN